MSTTPTTSTPPATRQRKNNGYRSKNKRPSRKNSNPRLSPSLPTNTGIHHAKHENSGVPVRKTSVPKLETPHETTIQIFPFAVSIAAIYILICFLMNDAKDDVGGIGVFIKNTFYGLFSNIAFLIPFMMGSIAFFYKKDLASGFFKYRLIFSAVCLALYSALAHLFSGFTVSFNIPAMFEGGKNYTGGGAVGGVLTEVLTRCVGTIGTGIFIISLSVIFSIFLFGYTPVDVIKFAVTLIRDYRNSRRQGFERELIVKRRDSNYAFKMKTHKYRISSGAVYAASKNKNKAVAQEKFDVSRETSELPKFADIKHKSKSKRGKGFDLKNNCDETERTVKNKTPETDNFERADEFIRPPESVESIKSEDILPKLKSEPVWIPEKSFFESDSDGSVKVYRRNGKDNKSNKKSVFSHPDILDDADDILFSDDNSDVAEAEGANLYFADSLKPAETIPARRGEAPESEADEQKSRELTFETTKVFDEYSDNQSLKEYKLPPLSYLTKDTNTQSVDVSGELASTASRLIETLESFGVKTKVSAVSRGPSVTRYELTPNAGVKVKSIVNLVDDIALNLAAGGVRIEAPIPGKAAVGVEVPNKAVSTVYLRTLLEDSQFRQAASKITVALGMDVAGNPIYSDISKMPHLLIAGATGMGKSVCINSIITSVLYKSKPTEVKLILIDPKKVELPVYNGIPHLLIPVVSDPKKAAGSLNWAVAEMENRFALIEKKGGRDLKSYNDAIANDPMAEKIPQIIIIIDELADLMMTAPADVEQSICRLAQKARAAGMHLIIGTQRPSVDVITGLIKANIPSRIAFTVASQIDSKIIIDAKGAEDLIGRGDMLYLPVGAAKPIRIQGAYVSERDVMNVTEFLKKQSDGGYDENILNEIERETQQCNTKGAKLLIKENSSGKTENDF